MKIVYVANLPENRGGGETKVAFDFAREISKEHEVVIVHPSADGKERLYTDNGLKKYGLKSAGKGDIYTPSFDPKTIKRLSDFLEGFKPDIIHSHTPFILGQLLQEWAIINNVPCIYTAHLLPDKLHSWIDIESLKSIGLRLFNNAFSKKYLAEYYNSFTAIIALNEESKRSLERIGYTGQIHTIPNGLNLKTFKSLKTSKPPIDEVNLLFIGSYSKRKNQEFLIDVAKNLPNNFKLKLVGPAQDSIYFKKLKNKIQREKVINVELLEGVDYKEVSQLLSESHFFISASKVEVQSLVILEALASGTPVIALENETTCELVDDTNGILLSKDSSAELFASKLIQLADEDEDRYFAMVHSSKMKSERFDIEFVKKAVTEVYLQHIGNSRKPRKNATRRVFAAGVILGAFALYGVLKTSQKLKKD